MIKCLFIAGNLFMVGDNAAINLSMSPVLVMENHSIYVPNQMGAYPRLKLPEGVKLQDLVYRCAKEAEEEIEKEY